MLTTIRILRGITRNQIGKSEINSAKKELNQQTKNCGYSATIEVF